MNWTSYKLVLTIVLSTLVYVTIVGNILVCLAVVLVRKLRKPQNYLLVSLAVSDLFVGLIVMPFAIVYELNDATWPLSNGLCNLWVSADVLSCTASILNLCAISVDRYRAITKPLEYSSVSSPRKMLLIIFGVWLCAACISLPFVLILGNERVREEKDQKFSICTPSQNFWYQLYATIGSFYIPLTVMIIVYAKILGVVADKKKQMNWTNCNRGSGGIGGGGGGSERNNYGDSNTDSRRLKPFIPTSRLKKEKFRPAIRLKDHKASTTLGIIMIAFTFCWLPFFVLALIRPLFELDVPEFVDSLFLWLGYFNSALNPVIYATLNRDFRGPFREILCCRCSTLDDLMRREIYDRQYGLDENCARNKKKALEASQATTAENVQENTNCNVLNDGTTTVAWSAI